MLVLLGLLSMFILIAVIVKLGLDHRTRRDLIEKGMTAEDIKNLYPANGQARALSSLKWALVLIGVGLAILIAVVLPQRTAEFTIGAMFLLAGIGLLIYYFVAARGSNRGE
jgi:uncharacterized membrane protein YeiB